MGGTKYAQRSEPAPVVIDKGHRERTPGGAVDAAQHLVGQLSGARFPAGVDLPAQIGKKVALVGTAGTPVVASLDAPLNGVSEGIINAR